MSSETGEAVTALGKARRASRPAARKARRRTMVGMLRGARCSRWASRLVRVKERDVGRQASRRVLVVERERATGETTRAFYLG